MLLLYILDFGYTFLNLFIIRISMLSLIQFF